MEFGFTLKPDHSLQRVVSLTRLAESAGFSHGWLFDSHVLWKEPYVLLALMAQNTTRIRLGTCVTNPATREPTVTASVLAVLQELSGGRMDLGIGRGDSARGGGGVGGMVAAPAHLGPRDRVRAGVRCFPALVSNHVVDLVKRYGERGLPADLTAFVRDRPGYDYRHHAESGSSNAAFVDDESVDRFCVTGEVEEHIEKLRRLAAIGVSQFNLYLMSGEEERILELYGERIIPALEPGGAA